LSGINILDQTSDVHAVMETVGAMKVDPNFVAIFDNIKVPLPPEAKACTVKHAVRDLFGSESIKARMDFVEVLHLRPLSKAMSLGRLRLRESSGADSL
jgi:hypothetical protein